MAAIPYNGVRPAKQYKFNCITLDGDQVERKGALTGGFTLASDNWKVTGEAQLNGDSTGLRSQSVRLGVGGRF